MVSGTLPHPPTFGHRHVTVPHRSLHAHGPRRQVHIRPLERHHFATPEPRFASQEHDEPRRPIIRTSRRFHEAFERVEVVEGGHRHGGTKQAYRAGRMIDEIPVHGGLEERVEDRQHVVHGLR